MMRVVEATIETEACGCVVASTPLGSVDLLEECGECAEFLAAEEELFWLANQETQ